MPRVWLRWLVLRLVDHVRDVFDGLGNLSAASRLLLARALDMLGDGAHLLGALHDELRAAGLLGSGRRQSAEPSRRCAIGRIAETVQQIAAATAEQARGSELIMKSAEKMRTITQHVERSSQEQARGGRQITSAIEKISNMVNSLNSASAARCAAASSSSNAARRIEEAPARKSRRCGHWWARWKRSRSRGLLKRHSLH